MYCVCSGVFMMYDHGVLNAYTDGSSDCCRGCCVFVGIAGSGMRFRSPSAVCDSGSFLRERPLRIGMAVVCGLPGEFNGWICVRFSTVLFTYIEARFVIRTCRHDL